MHEQILLQLIDDYFLPKGFRGSPHFIRDFHEYLLPLIKERRISANNVLYTAHNVPTNIYFLLAGIAYSTMEFKYRKMMVAPFLWHGPSIIGDGKSFYKQKSARFGVAIQGYAKIYELERRRLQMIEDRFPTVRANVRLAIHQQNKELRLWKEQLSHESAPLRLSKIIDNKPELVKQVLQKHLASHLGIYENYCSRLMRHYRQ